MKVTERRIVTQDWYETEANKNGWDSHGWFFFDDGKTMGTAWTVVEHIHLDKFGNPFVGVAEREVDV
jgi:hypothetical protein